MSAPTVWKFTLTPEFDAVRMPTGSRLLHVAEQHDALCLWAQVDPKSPMVSRNIAVVGTGHPVPSGMEHVGSALMVGGAFVFHVYDGGET